MKNRVVPGGALLRRLADLLLSVKFLFLYSGSIGSDGKSFPGAVARMVVALKQTTTLLTVQPVAGARLAYSPGIDGMRAIAVMAVLLYHSDLTPIPGGFLGVEVFFVISGYLITSLLFLEWQQTNRVNLKKFLLGRARRLLPASSLIIVCTTAYAVVFLPQEVAGLRGDVISAIGGLTNWYLIFENKSYFQFVGRPSIFRHLWSLAVEEQFYIIWPPLLAAILWLSGRRYVLAIALVGAMMSSILMALLYEPDLDPSRVYYGTDTRTAGLLIGAALAIVWADGRHAGRLNGPLLDLLGLAGLGTLGYFYFAVTEFQPLLYRGGFAVLGIATAGLIVAVVHPRRRIVPQLLALRPLVWIGLRSYSIYLWHWPIYMVTRPQLDVPIDGLSLLVIRLIATGLLAELSFRYVESPIRKGALGRGWRSLMLARGLRRGWLAARWASPMVIVGILGIAVARAESPALPSYLSNEAVVIMSSTDLVAPEEDVASITPTPIPTMVSASSVAGTGLVSSQQTPSAELNLTVTPSPSAQVPVKAATSVKSTTPTAESKHSSPPIALPTSTALASPTSPAIADRVMAIGDSVMLGAVGELQRAFSNVSVDAAVSRQVTAALEILRSQRAAGQLTPVVILHLGNNGTFSTKQFDEIMQVLVDVRLVIFVSVKVPRQWEGPNNTVLTDGVKRYPNTVLVDWHSASASHPEFFWDDGIHLRPAGAKVYADNIASLLRSP